VTLSMLQPYVPLHNIYYFDDYEELSDLFHNKNGFWILFTFFFINWQTAAVLVLHDHFQLEVANVACSTSFKRSSVFEI
jgi:hypothetical protein